MDQEEKIRQEQLLELAEEILEENLEAFLELAK
jgi:hypothetical protein